MKCKTLTLQNMLLKFWKTFPVFCKTYVSVTASFSLKHRGNQCLSMDSWQFAGKSHFIVSLIVFYFLFLFLRAEPFASLGIHIQLWLNMVRRKSFPAVKSILQVCFTRLFLSSRREAEEENNKDIK